MASRRVAAAANPDVTGTGCSPHLHHLTPASHASPDALRTHLHDRREHAASRRIPRHRGGFQTYIARAVSEPASMQAFWEGLRGAVSSSTNPSNDRADAAASTIASKRPRRPSREEKRLEGDYGTPKDAQPIYFPATAGRNDAAAAGDSDWRGKSALKRFKTDGSQFRRINTLHEQMMPRPEAAVAEGSGIRARARQPARAMGTSLRSSAHSRGFPPYQALGDDAKRRRLDEETNGAGRKFGQSAPSKESDRDEAEVEVLGRNHRPFGRSNASRPGPASTSRLSPYGATLSGIEKFTDPDAYKKMGRQESGGYGSSRIRPSRSPSTGERPWYSATENGVLHIDDSASDEGQATSPRVDKQVHVKVGGASAIGSHDSIRTKTLRRPSSSNGVGCGNAIRVTHHAEVRPESRQPNSFGRAQFPRKMPYDIKSAASDKEQQPTSPKLKDRFKRDDGRPNQPKHGSAHSPDELEGDVTGVSPASARKAYVMLPAVSQGARHLSPDLMTSPSGSRKQRMSRRDIQDSLTATSLKQRSREASPTQHSSPRRSCSSGSPESPRSDSSQRSNSASDLKQTQFRGISSQVISEHVKNLASVSNVRTAESRNDGSIGVRQLLCHACIESDVRLVWKPFIKAYNVMRSNGDPVQLPGNGDIVRIGWTEVGTMKVPRDPDLLIMFITGSKTQSSGGQILIEFESAADQELWRAQFGKATVVSTDTMMKIVEFQTEKIEEAYHRSQQRAATAPNEHRTPLNHRQAAGVPDEEEEEQIQYERDSSPEAQHSLRSQMKSGHAGGASIAENDKRRTTSAKSAYFPISDTSVRTTRRAVQAPRAPKLPPRPVVRWTQINKPKPWAQPVMYPAEGKDRVTVDFQDLERLDDDEFLNDNLIAFALRRIQESMPPEQREKVHFFNSFFFTGLSTKGYDAVKRWTRNQDLFTFQYIVVPINAGSHWYVMIICNLPNLPRRQEELENETETAKAAASRPQSDHHSVIEIDDDVVVSDASHSEVADEQGVQAANDMDLAESDGTLRVPASSSAAQGLENESKDAELPEPGAKLGPDPAASAPSSAVASGLASWFEKENKKKARKKPGGRAFDPEKPAIIALDSFETARGNEIRLLKDYLQKEARHKRGMGLDISDLQGINASGLPAQFNFSDCGVYLIRYIEEFAKDPRGFVTKVMERKRAELHHDFDGFSAAAKREELRNALLGLAGGH